MNCNALSLVCLIVGGLHLSAVEAKAEFHGLTIGASCRNPKCAGETTDCVAALNYNDGFGDPWVIQSASIVADVFGEASQQPIYVQGFGNVTCDDAGGVCDLASGENCALPCVIGSGSSTESGLPGDSNPGVIFFIAADYVMSADDTAPVFTHFLITARDLCSGTVGDAACPNIPQFFSAYAGTALLVCADDGDPCTIETCESDEDGSYCTAYQAIGSPCEAVCAGELNDDGVVDASDLAILLLGWGPNADAAADLNGDGVVDAFDLSTLLANWGTCD